MLKIRSKELAAFWAAFFVVQASAQDIRRLPPPTEELVGESVLAPQPDSPSLLPADDQPLLDTTLEAPVVRWYYPSYWLGPTPWDTGVELGLNGASGNNDAISTRAGGYLKRKIDNGALDASLYHNRTKSDGEETQNNALLHIRRDWSMGKSPWSLFLLNQTFYDKFQAYDYNFNLNSGVGYQAFDTDFIKLGASVGTGASRKFGGGRRDEWVPEAHAGVKWEQSINESQKFSAKFDYFPAWEDFNGYRILTDVSWEVELSRPSNVSLKFSLNDRFDSQPDGVNPHNTNYSILLLWKK